MTALPATGWFAPVGSVQRARICRTPRPAPATTPRRGAFPRARHSGLKPLSKAR